MKNTFFGFLIGLAILLPKSALGEGNSAGSDFVAAGNSAEQTGQSQQGQQQQSQAPKADQAISSNPSSVSAPANQNAAAAAMNGANGSALNPAARQTYLNSVGNTLAAERELAKYLIDNKVKKEEVEKVIKYMSGAVDPSIGLAKNAKKAAPRPQSKAANPIQVPAAENLEFVGRAGLSTLYSDQGPQNNKLENSIMVDGNGNNIQIQIDNSEKLDAPEQPGAANQFDQKLEHITIAANYSVEERKKEQKEVGSNMLSLNDALNARYTARGLASEEEEEGLIAGVLSRLMGESEETEAKDAKEDLGASDLAPGEKDFEPPFTLYSGKVKEKEAKTKGKVKDPQEVIEIGTHTGNGMPGLDASLMMAGRKVPTFVESMAEKALANDQFTLVLWAFIVAGLALIIRLFFSLQTAHPRGRSRGLGVVIPFRERLLNTSNPEFREEKTVWQDRQSRVSAEEVTEYTESSYSGPTRSIKITDPEFGQTTMITETTHVTGAIAAWTPKAERKLSPKKFYLRQEKKTKKWFLVQTDSHGRIARTIGEIASGTVVDGKTLGRHFAAKFYKLNAQGHWYPTADKPQLVLAVNKNLAAPKKWL